MEIYELSARELARSIRDGDLSSEEAVQSALDRIEAVDEQVGAVVEVLGDAALAAAREADARDEPLGSLHGLPVTFKVNTNLEGHATTSGVAAYQGNVAAESDPQVTSWLRAGAVPVGRTNCPPFAIGWTTENDLYGTTTNPWDPAVTPGGSSGGAAAAAATGMCALAQANDTAGSIRYPAACCGVAGIRPTVGRVPGWAGPPDRNPSLVAQTFLVQGPIARTVDDLRLGLEAMESPDPRDPGAGPKGAAPSAQRVAVVTDPGGPGMRGTSTPVAADATRQAATRLADAGYTVEEVELPQFGEAAELWWKLALTELKLGLLAEVRRAGDATAQAFFELMFEVYDREFGTVELADFAAGYGRRGGLRREVSLFMEDWPLLLMPVSGEPPFPPADITASAERVAELMAFAWPGMSVATLGLPALGLPATRGDGAPVGVQLVGRPYDEQAVFAAAEVIEARNGIRTPIDPSPGSRQAPAAAGATSEGR